MMHGARLTGATALVHSPLLPPFVALTAFSSFDPLCGEAETWAYERSQNGNMTVFFENGKTGVSFSEEVKAGDCLKGLGLDGCGTASEVMIGAEGRMQTSFPRNGTQSLSTFLSGNTT